MLNLKNMKNQKNHHVKSIYDIKKNYIILYFL